MEEILDKLNKVRHFNFTEICNDKDGYKYKVRMSCNKSRHLISELFSKVEGEYILKHVYTEDYNNVYLIYFNDLSLLDKLNNVLVDNKVYNIFFDAYRDLEYQYIYDKNKVSAGDNLVVKRVITDGITREVRGVVDKIYEKFCTILTNAGYTTTVSIQ